MDCNIFFITLLLYYLHFQFRKCNAESITYLSTEHPAITYFDQKYIKMARLTSRRLSRQDPRYYVDLVIVPRINFGNNVMAHFYFYQFLTNRYRPSFVEMHLGVCDLVEKNVFFGTALKRALGDKTCPFPPGEYNLQNMTVPYVPKGFPFTKGRIYCNVSLDVDGRTKVLLSGYIDMEVKVSKIKKA